MEERVENKSIQVRSLFLGESGKSGGVAGVAHLLTRSATVWL